jgi:hypothetical protein
MTIKPPEAITPAPSFQNSSFVLQAAGLNGLSWDDSFGRQGEIQLC